MANNPLEVIIRAQSFGEYFAHIKDRNAFGMAVAATVDRVNEQTLALIHQKLSGEVLNVRTGTLRSSISRSDAVAGTWDGDFFVRSKIGSGTRQRTASVPYARIHELGGQTKPHVILPKNGKVLAFTIGGKKIFCTKVNHPGSKIPARSYLMSSVWEMMPKMVDELVATARYFAKAKA